MSEGSKDSELKSLSFQDQLKIWGQRAVISGAITVGALVSIAGCNFSEGNEIPTPTSTRRPTYQKSTVTASPTNTPSFITTPIMMKTAAPVETPLAATVESLTAKNLDTSFVPEGEFTEERFNEVKKNLVLIEFTLDDGGIGRETGTFAKNPYGKATIVFAPHNLVHGIYAPVRIYSMAEKRVWELRPDKFLSYNNPDVGIFQFEGSPESYDMPEGIEFTSEKPGPEEKLLFATIPVDANNPPHGYDDSALLNARILTEIGTALPKWADYSETSVEIEGETNHQGSGGFMGITQICYTCDSDKKKIYGAGVVYGIWNPEAERPATSPDYAIIANAIDIPLLIRDLNEPSDSASNLIPSTSQTPVASSK